MDEYKPHVGFLELHRILLNGSDLNRVYPVIACQFLIFAGCGGRPFGFRADVKKPVIEKRIGLYGILFEQVMEIPFDVVIGCGEILRKKNIKGKGL